MPKRPISDLDSEYSHCLQSKIHVSNKEINQGIGGASSMKAVYQRTLNLLFQGSSKGAKCNQPAVISTAPTALHNSHHLPRYSQTILTSNGQISSPTEEQQRTALPATAPLPCKCMSCSSLNTVTLERCRFCEGTFCEGCFKICCVCAGEFCNKCSIQIYSRDECSICLSCATERGSL